MFHIAKGWCALVDTITFAGRLSQLAAVLVFIWRRSVDCYIALVIVADAELWIMDQVDHSGSSAVRAKERNSGQHYSANTQLYRNILI